MHSKNQGKKLTDMLLVYKKVTFQVRSKTHSNKPNKKKQMNLHKARILQQV